jgi:hypothetical protein
LIVPAGSRKARRDENFIRFSRIRFGSSGLGAGETSETGKWVAVYRRESNGEWRFHWSTYNSNHPPKLADH